nr:hypothetical protein [Tanacetum cinerariifolium]
MHEKFQMSAMGELNFFLGMQVLQKEDCVFLSQDKYVGDILKKFRYSDVRSSNTPMDKENPWVKRIFRYPKGHPKLGLWYPKESPFDLVAYLESDYGGANQDRKLTTGGSASGCGQVLWIQNQLLDYGPSFSGRIVPLFDSMLVPPGEGSGTPTEPHHTPSLEAKQTSHTPHSSPTLPPITTAPIPTVTPSDEPTSPIGDVSQGKACPTISSLEAEQDRANIAKTSTLPHDLAPRVTSPAADEDSMQHKLDELTALCTSLEGGGITHYGDDAPIKGKRLDEGEAAAERLNAASMLSSGGVQVVPTATAVSTATVSIPTGSGVVPTASLTIPTAVPIFATATIVTPYTKRKDKKRCEGCTVNWRKDRANQQAGQDHHSKILQYQAQQRKSRTKKQKRDYYMAVIKSNLCWKIEDFIPMGSKEEVVRFKRKGVRFEQEGAKKLKTSEEAPEEVKTPDEALVKESLNIRPAASDKEMELWVELKRLYKPDDREIFMLVEKDYPLRKGLTIVMISYKLQVENYSQMASDLILKIYKIENRPRQEDD